MIKIIKNIFVCLCVLFCISKYSYAIDENGALGTAAVDYDTMYIKYAMGAVTVGYQKSESDGNLSSLANDDEFQAIGVSYAVSEELSISIPEASKVASLLV